MIPSLASWERHEILAELLACYDFTDPDGMGVDYYLLLWVRRPCCHLVTRLPSEEWLSHGYWEYVIVGGALQPPKRNFAYPTQPDKILTHKCYCGQSLGRNQQEGIDYALNWWEDGSKNPCPREIGTLLNMYFRFMPNTTNDILARGIWQSQKTFWSLIKRLYQL